MIPQSEHSSYDVAMLGAIRPGRYHVTATVEIRPAGTARGARPRVRVRAKGPNKRTALQNALKLAQKAALDPRVVSLIPGAGPAAAAALRAAQASGMLKAAAPIAQKAGRFVSRLLGF